MTEIARKSRRKEFRSYFLGAWYATGKRVTEDGRKTITMSKKDEFIARRIKNEMKGATIRLFQQSFFVSAIVNEDLEIYKEDFVRGFVEACSNIANVKDGKLNLKIKLKSTEMLIWIFEQFKSLVDVQGGSIDESKGTLTFESRDSRLIGLYMYQNNPRLYLKRKKERFDHF